MVRENYLCWFSPAQFSLQRRRFLPVRVELRRAPARFLPVVSIPDVPSAGLSRFGDVFWPVQHAFGLTFAGFHFEMSKWALCQ